MKEITLKGTIDEELDDEITYCYELRQIKDLKCVVLSYSDDILYVSIKKEEILDKEEKEYLRAVIRPFGNKVYYIKKILCGYQEYIEICVFGEFVHFPFFEKGTMYKGMEEYKEYTLEELGL